LFTKKRKIESSIIFPGILAEIKQASDAREFLEITEREFPVVLMVVILKMKNA